MVREKIGMTTVLGFTTVVVLGFSFFWVKDVKANSITCSVDNYAKSLDSSLTINATIDFTATEVYAIIENEKGAVVNSHLNLSTSNGTDYSVSINLDENYLGKNFVGVYGTVSGGDTLLCNASDGTDWIKKSLNDTEWIGRYRQKVVYFKNKLWLIGGFGDDFYNEVWYSQNGVDWTKVVNNGPWGEEYDQYRVLVFNDKIWFIGGYQFNTSWTSITLKADIWSTSDGINWSLATSNPGWTARGSFGAVVYDNKMWITGGCNQISGLSCENYTDEVWYSSNGTTWNLATDNPGWTGRYYHSLVVHNDGSGDRMFLLGGIDSSGYLNDVWSSSDGSTWAEESAAADWEARYTTALSYYNKIWIFGGKDTNGNLHNDIWSSSDGTGWTQEKDDIGYPSIGTQPSKWTHWTYRREPAIINFNDGTGTKLWLFGGYDGRSTQNDIWYSSDAINWTLSNTNYDAEFGHRFDTSLTSYNNKLWVIGGLSKGNGITNDVWSSSSGNSWSCEYGPYTSVTEGISCNNAAPSFSARWGHRTLVYDDGGGEDLYMIGGCDTGETNFTNCPAGHRLNQVWSFNGSSWTQKTPSANWVGRYEPAVANFDNKMWFLGGAGYNDVWYSINGSNWTAATNAGWSKRMGHRAVALNDGSGEKLFVMGGFVSGICVGGTNPGAGCNTDAACNGGTCSDICLGGPNVNTVCTDDNDCSGYPCNKGRVNDVWSNDDPINNDWTLVTDSPGWNGRYTFALYNYNNKLYLHGGNREGISWAEWLGSDGVWSSLDGKNWTNIMPTVPFEHSDFLSYTVHDNRMYFTGGDSNGSTNNEVWASTFNNLAFYVKDDSSEQVIVSATIPASLSFSLSANQCDFGTFSPTVINTCSYDVEVNTNARVGYTALIRSDGGLRNSSYSLANISSDIGPNESKIDAGYEEYGIATSETENVGINAVVSDCNSLNNNTIPVDAVVVPTSETSFALSTSSVSNDITSLCHAISISSSTPAGDYSQSITITVVANF